LLTYPDADLSLWRLATKSSDNQADVGQSSKKIKLLKIRISKTGTKIVL